MPAEMQIRAYDPADADAVWRIFHAVVQGGDAYAWLPETPYEEFLQVWPNAGGHCYVAEADGEIVGAYLLKPVQPGLGAHIANAAYMTRPDARGRGIGAALGRHSLEEARRLGYRGLQFNLVVSSNTAAVHLWRKLGFQIVGSIPGAFHHATLGYVDAHIMFQSLTAS